MRVLLTAGALVALASQNRVQAAGEGPRTRAIVGADSCLVLTPDQLSDLLTVAKWIMEPSGARLRRDNKIPLVPRSAVVSTAPSPASCQHAARTYRALRGSFMVDSAYAIAVVQLGADGYLGRFLWVPDEGYSQYVFLDSSFTARILIQMYR